MQEEFNNNFFILQFVLNADYEDWLPIYHEANNAESGSEREEMLREAYEKMENRLWLLGATGTF